jgi:hypothetical protein
MADEESDRDEGHPPEETRTLHPGVKRREPEQGQEGRHEDAQIKDQRPAGGLDIGRVHHLGDGNGERGPEQGDEGERQPFRRAATGDPIGHEKISGGHDTSAREEKHQGGRQWRHLNALDHGEKA